MKAVESSQLETVLPDVRPHLATADGRAGQRRTVAAADEREHLFETLEHLIAAGPVVAELPARANFWTPEKRLAGAALASALVEIRDHHGDRSHRNLVIENLRWVASDDTAWPFSFVRLCQLFDLEPSWVRGVVNRWIAQPTPAPHAQESGSLSGHPSIRPGGEHRRRRARSTRRGVHAAIA